MRRGHAPGLWELGRELPGPPTEWQEGAIPLMLALTVTEWARVAPYPAKNRVLPDPWA